MKNVFFTSCALISLGIPNSNAAVINLVGGQTDIDFNEGILVSFVTVDVAVNNVSSALSAATDFDLSLPIRSDSTATAETSPPPSLLADNLGHDGSFDLVLTNVAFSLNQTVSFDDISIDVGTLTINGTVNGGVNIALFDIVGGLIISPTPTSITVEGQLEPTVALSNEISTLLPVQVDLSDTNIGNIRINAVPEPSSLLLTGLALFGLARRRR